MRDLGEKCVGHLEDGIGGGMGRKAAALLEAVCSAAQDSDDVGEPRLITMGELARIFRIAPGEVGAGIRPVMADIFANPMVIRRDGEGEGPGFVTIPYLSSFAFDPKVGLTVTVNKEALPYLVRGKG